MGFRRSSAGTITSVLTGDDLNSGLATWLISLPGRMAGKRWFDLCSGNHADMTTSNSTNGWRPASRPGGYGSILFDGSNQQLQTIKTSATDLQFFTATTWIRLTGSTTNDWIFSTTESGSPGWGLDIQTSAGVSTIFFDHFVVATVVSTTAVVNDGFWHQVGIFRNRANLAGIILDGKIIATASYSTAFTNSTFTIGNRGFSGVKMTGSQDCLKVWNRGLSGAECFNDFNDSRESHPRTLVRTGRRVARSGLTGGPFPHYTRRQLTGGMIPMSGGMA